MTQFGSLVLTGLVPRLFLGLLVLGAAVDTVIPLLSGWLPLDTRPRLVVLALGDGAVIGLFSFIAPLFRGTASARSALNGAIVGTLAGLLAPLVLDPVLGVLTLCAVLTLSGINVRRFTLFIKDLLHPNALTDWNDARELIVIHINLLATYTIVNAVLTVHSGEGKALANAFNFARGSEMVVDALYFSVVLMTTLGFGDVTPQSPLAKLLVSGECLLSYTMLALTIGVVTRGIVSRK